MHLKMSSAKWRPFCVGLNVLKWSIAHTHRRAMGIKWKLLCTLFINMTSVMHCDTYHSNDLKTRMVLTGKQIELWSHAAVTTYRGHLVPCGVNIGSGNGLCSAWHQAITETNADLTLHLDPLEQTPVKYQSKYANFHSRKCIWKSCLHNAGLNSSPPSAANMRQWIGSA